MCGINSIIYFDKEKTVEKEKIEQMNSLLSHRGPDGKGIFIHNNVGLGHVRSPSSNRHFIFANVGKQAAGVDDPLDELRIALELPLAAAGEIFHHAAGDVDLHLLAVADPRDRLRRLDNREADIDGITEEDASEAFGDDTGYP